MIVYFVYYPLFPILTQPPQKSYATAPESTKTSNLSLEIAIDLDNLKKQYSNGFTPQRYDFNDINGCFKKLGISIDCKDGFIAKAGDLSIFTTDNNARFSVPFVAQVTLVGLGTSITPEIKATTTLDWNLKISTDWRSPDLKTKVHLAECHVTLLWMKISFCWWIKDQVNAQVVAFNQALKNYLDKEIKRMATKMWRMAHRVDKIHTNPNMYLVTEPKNVSFSGFNAMENILSATVTVGAKFSTIISAKPSEPTPTILPLLSDNTTNKFAIILPIKISYDALETQLKNLLKMGKKRTYKNNDITFHKIEIYPSSPNIVIAVDLEIDTASRFFDTEGTETIYLWGKPVVDNKTKVMKIENLQLSGKIGSNLVDISIFMIDSISQNLSYNFADDYDKLITEINKKFKIADKLILKLNVDYINVETIYMLKNDLYINITTQGNLVLKF